MTRGIVTSEPSVVNLMQGVVFVPVRGGSSVNLQTDASMVVKVKLHFINDNVSDYMLTRVQLHLPRSTNSKFYNDNY